jgi:hypothetical protein
VGGPPRQRAHLLRQCGQPVCSWHTAHRRRGWRGAAARRLPELPGPRIAVWGCYAPRTHIQKRHTQRINYGER